ncbi:MAG TPA: DinB family protein [Paludibaculum sp.]|jgi:uncharacterized damage-inducible protein DinB
MISAPLLLTHLNYSEWASIRLLDAATALEMEELTRDHGTADKSVLGALVHAFAADRNWLTRVRLQTPCRFIEESDYSLKVLRRDWPILFQGWREWLASLSPDDLAAEIRYLDFNGRPFATPAWQIILHVVNHATHHRGQVSGFLRKMGHRPPPVDLIVYYRGL